MTISANAEATEAGVDRATKWAIALFFLVLFVPGSFYVGVRMTPFRLYLILMAFPMALRFLKDPGLRVGAVDVLVLLAIAWRSLALVANHQTSELLNAGASFVELFFAYLLGRVFIRSAADYRYFFQCFLVTLVAFLPFALLEATTYTRVLRRIAGVVLAQPPEVISGPAIRFGLMRVQASFDHAVLFGMFASIGFANMFYLYAGRFPRNVLYPGFVGFMTLLAISSSSMIILALQGFLMAYELSFRRVPAKWYILIVVGAVVFVCFELIFGTTIPDYIVSKLALNQAGAETRFDQIEYGLKEVWRHPVFGIGLNIPRLPFWRSDIFDNFWLHTAVRFGIPSFLFIASGFALHFLMIVFRRLERRDLRMIRLGYTIPFVTLILLIGSIPLWGSALVFVMAYFGAGAWLYAAPHAAPAPSAPRDPAARRRAAPGRAGAAIPAPTARAVGAAAPGARAVGAGRAGSRAGRSP